MRINDLKRFEEFAQSCGNRYLAVKIIARWARDLGEQFNEYHISESKLIETILTGKWYYSESEMSQRKSANDDDHILDILDWTIDQSIVEEVKKLYKLSIRNRRLQCCTNNSFTQGQISKVNVLLRILWYSADR